MSQNPTKDQLDAINVRNKSVILSAAAGSGKTSTLINRIIKTVTDTENPADLSRILVVTFTRSAASELRERIAKALSDALKAEPDNERLIKQEIILGSADICTIDSFFQNVIRSEFENASYTDGTPLSPDFRIADDAELSCIIREALQDTINGYYEKESESLEFIRFTECFSNPRNEGNLVDDIFDFYKRTRTYNNPNNIARECAERYRKEASYDYFDTVQGGYLKNKLSETVKACLDFFDYAFGHGFVHRSCIQKMTETRDMLIKLNDILNNGSGYSAVREILSGFVSSGYEGKLYKSDGLEYLYIRDYFKETIDANVNTMKKYTSVSGESIGKIMLETADKLDILSDLITDLDRAFIREKSIRHICSFDDITDMVRRIMINPDGTPTETAEKYRRHYDAVYIDEYQDVNRVQDAIFNAISRRGNKFVVGDIKQCIYQFRSSDPSVFGEQRDIEPRFGTAKADKGDSCSIFMSENFRCDKSIIDFVNNVSRYTFRVCKGTVAYCNGDDLVYGKKEGECNEPVNITLIPGNFPSRNGISAEAEMVSAKIAELLKNGGKEIKASHIAVISRYGKALGEIAKALRNSGIPVKDLNNYDFFDNPEVTLVYSLLSSVDNPQNDISLAGVLRSPFFGYTMDELIAVRTLADKSFSLFEALSEAATDKNDDPVLREKCERTVGRFLELRKYSRELPTDRFVRKIYRDFNVMSLTVKGREAELVGANLNRLYDFSRDFSRMHGDGLSGFVRYLEMLMRNNLSSPEPDTSPESDAVRLMTMHKSKGLEFPIVFVVGCGSQFIEKEKKYTLQYDENYGIALNLTDSTGFAYINSPLRDVILSMKNDKQKEEELRLLYVALTRAKNKLFIYAKPRNNNPESCIEPYRFMPVINSRSSVLSSNSMFRILCPAIANEDDSFRLTIAEAGEAVVENEKTSGTENEDDKSSGNNETVINLTRTFTERFAFVYDTSVSRIPAKLSVSRLYPDILDDDGAQNLTSDTIPELNVKPHFLESDEEKSRATAAERGTATHVFLQFCDFGNVVKNGVNAELQRLIEGAFIPDKTASLVNLRQLEMFFDSKFFKSVRNARELYREQRFNILLDAADFTEDDELRQSLKGEKLLVQGVVDLMFTATDGKLTLCDYKTDRIPSEIIGKPDEIRQMFTQRHGRQLSYYARAVREFTGSEPDRMCIYSLALGKEIEITVKPL